MLRRRSQDPSKEAGSDIRSGGQAPAILIGAGRLAVGIVFLAKPLDSVRFLGVDSATSERIAWLARMTAARDIALGLGTVAGVVLGRGAAAWLIAGSACDAVDATAISHALSRRQVAAVPAIAAAICAAAASAAAIVTVARHHRHA